MPDAARGPHADRDGQLSPLDVIETLVEAAVNVMARYPGIVVANLFALLPEIGLTEDDVPLEALYRLAETACWTNATIEFNERWMCPQARTLNVLKEAGVSICCASDAYRREDIGVYSFAVDMVGALGKVSRAA